MTAAWPASLPQYVLEQGYSEQMPDQLIETPMEAGKPKVRRRYTMNNPTFTVTIAMTLGQKAIFETFFDEDLQGGSLPFTWVNPTSQLATTFRFRKPVPKWTVRGNAYLVSAALEVVR